MSAPCAARLRHSSEPTVTGGVSAMLAPDCSAGLAVCFDNNMHTLCMPPALGTVPRGQARAAKRAHSAHYSHAQAR